jgi:hypothetical protein
MHATYCACIYCTVGITVRTSGEERTNHGNAAAPAGPGKNLDTDPAGQAWRVRHRRPRRRQPRRLQAPAAQTLV